MTQSFSFSALLLAGFIGATATACGLAMSGAPVLSLILGYSLGGAITVMGCALLCCGHGDAPEPQRAAYAKI